MWLVFSTLAAAEAAIATINANISFPAGNVTQTWAVPLPRSDGTYAIPKPDDKYMAGVVGYETEENLIFTSPPVTQP